MRHEPENRVVEPRRDDLVVCENDARAPCDCMLGDDVDRRRLQFDEVGIGVELRELVTQHVPSREAGEQRPMGKYLDRFREIRRLQEVIVARADRAGVAVIENTSAERATRGVAELVLSATERTRERV